MFHQLVVLQLLNSILVTKHELFVSVIISFPAQSLKMLVRGFRISF